MKGPSLKISANHCFKDSSFSQPVKSSAKATLQNGLLDELCIDPEGEVIAVTNGVIPNAYRPIAIGSSCVVHFCDFNSPFPLKNKRDGNVCNN